MKLTYFNGRGRAELSRLILAHAGAEYEDGRIEFAEWPALKPKTICGQIPILEVDGIMLAQSMTIARYLARRYNLVGKTDLEAAQADMIVDCATDAMNAFVAIIREKDLEKQKGVIDKFISETTPNFLNMMQTLLEKNGGEYFVGSGLTWADIAVFSFMEMLVMGHGMAPAYQNPEALKDHKKLQDLSKRVAEVPNIKAWLEKRPKTPF